MLVFNGLTNNGDATMNNATTNAAIHADFATRLFSHSEPNGGGMMYGDYPLEYYSEKTILALCALEIGETHKELRAHGVMTWRREADID